MSFEHDELRQLVIDRDKIATIITPEASIKCKTLVFHLFAFLTIKSKKIIDR